MSFALTVLALASKPIGYLRTLIIAWAFGTSAGMDAFHLATGIIGLFTGSVANALENAVLPELIRIRERAGGAGDVCRATSAFISCFVIALSMLFTAALIIAPGILIRFFAGGFDAERISTGARMLWWLIPFALVTMYAPMLGIWANVTERYTLGQLTGMPYNFIAIPAILISMRHIAVYSVAFSMSVGSAVTFAIFLVCMRGFPIVWRARDVAWDSIKRICENSAYLIVVFAAGTLYTIVDRYFASKLPVGSVAAISYAAVFIGILTALANTPMTYFLSMITKSAVTNRMESLETIKSAITLALAYFIPISAFLAVASNPIISLVLGWGSFDSRSVAMTSLCLATYSAGFAFAVASSLMYRYAMALGKLKAIMVTTYALVALNAVLDYAFVFRWGLFGLAAATSLTQAAGFVIYYVVIIDTSLIRFLTAAKFFHHLVIASVFAYVASFASGFGSAALLFVSAAFLILYLFAAERFGLMEQLPPGWRPSQFLKFVMRAAKSYANAD